MWDNNFLILAVGLCLVNLLPVGWWMWWYVRLEDKKEPLGLVLKCFLFGMCSALPLVVLRFFLPESWWGEERLLPTVITGGVVVFYCLSALLEEMSKHMAVLKVMNDDVQARNELSDGITYGVSAALGFSLVENMLYVVMLSFWERDMMVLGSVVLLRGLLTSFAHTVFSGLFGYFYARAYIRPNIRIITRSAFDISWKSLIRKLHPRFVFFPVMRSYRRGFSVHKEGFNAIELVIEGLWAAVVFHVMFNLLLVLQVNGVSYWWVALPFIAALGILVLVLYERSLHPGDMEKEVV